MLVVTNPAMAILLTRPPRTVRRRRLGRPVAAAAIVAVLAAANVLNNHLAVPMYVITSLVAAGIVLAIHRGAGGTWEHAGLGRSALPRGLRWAFALGAVVAVCYLVAALLPTNRALFLDARVDRVGMATIAFQIFVRIPLGTVLLEEIGFRGVLYGLVRPTHGAAWATTTSSALFALWHIPPAVQLVSANPALALGLPRTVAVSLALVGAALVGVVLCELRRRSGSLLAPAGLHWATNAFGYLTATVVLGGR